MGVQNPNSTDYVHPDEPNLLNLHKALKYNADGEPVIRADIGSDININGDVNIPGTVTVDSTPEDPVHTHITEVGTSGILAVPYMPIQGTVSIGTDGTVSLSATTLSALENITVGGSVSVSNFPATQAVTGTFWQATQPVSGTVTIQDGGNTITVDGTVTANVTFPSIYKVSKNTSDNTASNAIAVEISTGNGQVVSGTNALPARVLNDEALISYARGAAVTEAEVLNAYLIDKSGATETLGTTPATMSTVWDSTGLYPWNTFAGTGAKLYVKSTTDDAKVRGKTVMIEGLDSNYNLITETVTLDGTNSTTAVATVANFYRVVAATLSGNNTNGIPHDYNIELHYGSSGGTLVAQINSPYGKTQSCTYTVPAGFEAFILSVNGSSGHTDEITSMIWIKPYQSTWHQVKTFKFISGSFDHNFRTPLRVAEKTDIEIRAYALVESSRIGTEFQMLVIPKP